MTVTYQPQQQDRGGVPGARVARRRQGFTRLAAALTLSAVVTVMLVFVASPARAVTPTDHGNMQCNGTQVVANPPQVSTPTRLDYNGRFERVFWTADLYRWNGARWVAWDYGNKPWLSGLLQANGIVVRTDSRWAIHPFGTPTRFIAFNDLPRGFYRTTSTWSGHGPYFQSSSYCTVL